VDIRTKKGDMKAAPSAYIEFTTADMAKKVLGMGTFKVSSGDSEFVVGIEERLKPRQNQPRPRETRKPSGKTPPPTNGSK